MLAVWELIAEVEEEGSVLNKRVMPSSLHFRFVAGSSCLGAAAYGGGQKLLLAVRNRVVLSAQGLFVFVRNFCRPARSAFSYSKAQVRWFA